MFTASTASRSRRSWVAAAVACVVLVIVHLVLSFRLNDASDTVFQALHGVRVAPPPVLVAKMEAAPKAAPPKAAPQSDLLKRVLASLDDDKAENIVAISLEGRSAIADAAVIASGRSSRHVAAIAEHLARKLKEGGYGTRPVAGAAQGDWVLVDAGDVIVHIFRPEVRDYYDLEGMWSVS